MAEDLPPGLISQKPGACIWWLEDDRELCRLLVDRLRACGWRLTLFRKVEALLAALKRDEPDLLLLDRMLPGANGMDLLLQLRSLNHHFPVLILSGMGEPNQRIEGLATGANDYLCKPFRLRELLWRIERLLQTTHPSLMRPSSQEGVIPLGPLTLEPTQGCLRNAAGSALELSRGDCALLLGFLQAPEAVLSREQLARASGSLVNLATSRTLDVRLSRLRRHLLDLSEGRVSIEAVRGQGYRLTLPGPDPRPERSPVPQRMD
jgi:DNA-binding response OmpR family regulator